MVQKDLCHYPIVIYVAGFTGRQHFNESFARANLTPNVPLSAADTDIIKAYVLEGLGVGVVAGMACDATADTEISARDPGHLFPAETTRIASQKGK